MADASEVRSDADAKACLWRVYVERNSVIVLFLLFILGSAGLRMLDCGIRRNIQHMLRVLWQFKDRNIHPDDNTNNGIATIRLAFKLSHDCIPNCIKNRLGSCSTLD